MAPHPTPQHVCSGLLGDPLVCRNSCCLLQDWNTRVRWVTWSLTLLCIWGSLYLPNCIIQWWVSSQALTHCLAPRAHLALLVFSSCSRLYCSASSTCPDPSALGRGAAAAFAASCWVTWSMAALLLLTVAPTSCTAAPNHNCSCTESVCQECICVPHSPAPLQCPCTPCDPLPHPFDPFNPP